MRRERGDLAAEWIDCGERQAPDMGEEALLSCRFAIREDAWVDADIGVCSTQVRVQEDPEVLEILLDRLLDRFEEFLPGAADPEASARFIEKLRWFGPEMAEEY